MVLTALRRRLAIISSPLPRMAAVPVTAVNAVLCWAAKALAGKLKAALSAQANKLKLKWDRTDAGR